MESSADGLVLAGIEIHPGLRAGVSDLRVERDAARFRRLLRSSRPTLVVVCAPPATTDDIASVADQRRRRRDMRAVLIDGSDASAERLGALRAGFDEAIDERMAPAELAGRLALLADEARMSRGSRIDRRISISPEITLDIDSRDLHIDGRAIHLRPREFALLEIFARHPDRTFTREQLLDAVGARTSIRDLRTVDVHIRWLREKLRRDGRITTRLVTVRGVGYRLERGPDGPASVNRTLTKRQSDVDGANQD
ncbi:MAG TPA: response regulator transcription factor [Candidatus Limnocylindrales bacterium]|nr:response regulator transcription factor [Candidatus Limnocylindrales bacterium]